MYFVFYFIAGIVIFTFLLIKFLEIIFDKKGYKTFGNRFYATLLFVVMITTFINIIVAIQSYRTTINMVGHQGDAGIQGKRGKKGNKGNCSEQCGQQVCYVDIIDHANDIFQEEVSIMLSNSDSLKTKMKPGEFKINNGFFLEKINSICKSEQYQSIMLGKHPNKPTEKKLIEYLKGIVENWVKYLVNPLNNGCLLGQSYDLDNHKCNDKPNSDDGDLIEQINRGVRFLLDTQYTVDVLNFTDSNDSETFNPIEELKKYDIWNWGDELIIEPLELKFEVKDLDKPEPDQARLQIKKSNNYKWVYGTENYKDKWDDTNCDYNQMGSDRTNPQNLNKCVFLNKQNYLKDYVNTWKTDVYRKDQEMSLYNSEAFQDGETNQIFYPVGSIWRGTENREKPYGSLRSPPSKNSCGVGHGEGGTLLANNDGPEKETLLVSGDVKKPKDMKLIWDSEEGCNDCQIHHVKVYRPEAPDGYVCLGDYVKEGTASINDDDYNKIRCVPKDCVREKKIGNRFYDNKGVSYDKYDSYTKYVARTPYDSEYQLSASFWTAGVDDMGAAEEQKNLYGLEINSDDGYNLFRMGRGYRKPKEKTYVIKEECLMPGGGGAPKHPFFDAEDFIKNNDSDTRYNAGEYFGKKPPFAVLTNNDNFSDNQKSLLNFEKKRIRLYLQDDLNNRKTGETGETPKSDTYFIKTYNPKKNDFSNYVVTNINGDVNLTTKPNKKNKYHRWTVRINSLTSLNPDNSSSNQQVISSSDYIYDVFIESYGLTEERKQVRALRQYYNNMGKSKFDLVDKTSSASGDGNWIYSQMIILDPPNFFG
jgi:hypothetical protein